MVPGSLGHPGTAPSSCCSSQSEGGSDPQGSLPLGVDSEQHGLPRWLSGKEFVCQYRRRGFNPWVGKIPWRRKRQPTPVFMPGKPHGQGSLAGYSP